MTPLLFLAIIVIVTAGARLTDAIAQQRHRDKIQSLARDWQMHYSPGDRFRLAAGVAERFPVPGAADVLVVDLLYVTEGSYYRYLFSVDYTVGVTHGKHRQRRVMTFREPRGRATAADWSPLMLAPEDLPILQQYLNLHESISSKKNSERDESPRSES